jgi:hypothetical protein
MDRPGAVYVMRGLALFGAAMQDRVLTVYKGVP